MEQGAFLPFYEQHKETLYHYACTLTANAHQAEDALQTAWLSCLRQEETFDALPPDKRLAWMSVVVKNAARSLWRQEQRYAPWDETWDMPAPTPGDPRPIVTVIQAMPEPYRRLLELKFLLEWSNKEIAKHLGLSQTAVSTRLNRGRTPTSKRPCKTRRPPIPTPPPICAGRSGRRNVPAGNISPGGSGLPSWPPVWSWPSSWWQEGPWRWKRPSGSRWASPART